MSSIMYINLVVEGKQTLGSISCITTAFCSLRLIYSTVCLWSYSRTQNSSITAIAPHWSSSYPEYLSPTWDENMQRAVVWTRLQEHCKLANHSLSKQTKWYHALWQEFQKTQVKSSHEPLSHDKKAGQTLTENRGCHSRAGHRCTCRSTWT